MDFKLEWLFEKTIDIKNEVKIVLISMNKNIPMKILLFLECIKQNNFWKRNNWYRSRKMIFLWNSSEQSNYTYVFKSFKEKENCNLWTPRSRNFLSLHSNFIDKISIIFPAFFIVMNSATAYGSQNYEYFWLNFFF